MAECFLGGSSLTKSILSMMVYKTIKTNTSIISVELPTGYDIRNQIQGFLDWTSWTPKSVSIFQPGYGNYASLNYNTTLGFNTRCTPNTLIYELPIGVAVPVTSVPDYASGTYTLTALPYISSGKLYIPISFVGNWTTGTMAHNTQFLIY